MKAGIDCGSTLTKFAWLEGDELRLRSTRDETLDAIIEDMINAGVTSVRSTGIGPREPLMRSGRLALGVPQGDRIAEEIAFQARGVRRLMEGTAPRDFVLVSVGSGTSFTLVSDDAVEQHHLGSAAGGQVIAVPSLALGIPPGDIDAFAEKEAPLDLLLRDALPETAGTPFGEFVVAHFGKVEAPLTPAAVCRTFISLVSTIVAHDLLGIRNERGSLPEDVVLIGTPVSAYATLRKQLSAQLPLIGLKPHFPPNGAFAAAVGALYAE